MESLSTELKNLINSQWRKDCITFVRELIASEGCALFGYSL